MNRLLVLLLVTTSIAASGCTGVPEGTATNGTLVTLDWTARDPDTGEVLAQGAGLRFLVGQGGSGLGEDLERSVRGRQVNETYTLLSEDDESRVFDEELARAPQFIGSDAAEGEIPVAAFNRSLGHMPEVGEVFEYNPFYQAEVIAVGEENLTYRFHLPGGEQRDPVPFVGAVLVSRIEGDDLVRSLDPVPGSRFVIDPPTPERPTSLNLQPGSYVTVGAEDGDILYRRSDLRDAALAERPVEFEVTVVDVQRLTGGTTDLAEGNYGVRPGSPYVDGDPSRITPLDHGDVEHDHGDEAAEDSHAAPADGHDDGHGDHGH